MNWFEGFRRLKKVLIIVFILLAIGVSCARWLEKPYLKTVRATGGERGFFVSEDEDFWAEETAKPNEWVVEWRWDKYIFPEDTSLKKITKTFKQQENTTFFPVFGAMILSIIAGIVALEMCFWIPVYIARGFGKSVD